LASFLEVTLFELREAAAFFKNSQTGSLKFDKQDFASLPRKPTRFREEQADSSAKSKIVPPPGKNLPKAPNKPAPQPPSGPSFTDRLASTFSIFGKDEEKEKEKPKSIQKSFGEMDFGSTKQLRTEQKTLAKSKTDSKKSSDGSATHRRSGSLDLLKGQAKENKRIFEQKEEPTALSKNKNKKSTGFNPRRSEQDDSSFLNRARDDEVVIAGPTGNRISKTNVTKVDRTNQELRGSKIDVVESKTISPPRPARNVESSSAPAVGKLKSNQAAPRVGRSPNVTSNSSSASGSHSNVLSNQSAKSGSSKGFCRHCGAEKTIASAKFCSQCGEPL
jgi:hypothetical protein